MAQCALDAMVASDCSLAAGYFFSGADAGRRGLEVRGSSVSGSGGTGDWWPAGCGTGEGSQSGLGSAGSCGEFGDLSGHCLGGECGSPGIGVPTGAGLRPDG